MHVAHLKFKIRFAHLEDTETILSFIHALAVYENMEDQVIATKNDLKHALFDLKQAEVILAELDDQPIGFALFFHNFSTFQGRANIYLEDLFILDAYRNQGYGKKMLSFLAKIALDRKCMRLDWSCLNWNKPSIDFYTHLGAKSLDEWLTFRIIGEDLKKLADLK